MPQKTFNVTLTEVEGECLVAVLCRELRACDARMAEHRNTFGSFIVTCDTAEDRMHMDAHREAVERVLASVRAASPEADATARFYQK